MKEIIFLITFLSLFLAACSQPPPLSLKTDSKQNLDAPLAWFGENNASIEMRIQYAEAMQNAGIFNFTAENFSEERIEHPIEIRMNYSEEKGKFKRIPILHLQAEILEKGQLKFKFALKEESDKSTHSPKERAREKKFREEVLLQRFLEELKRIKTEDKNKCLGA